MSKQTIAELIAEARQLIRHSSVSVPEHANMLGRLATALEAAEQRAELAEANLSVEENKNAGYRAKNNQLAAVVEKVRAADSASSSWDHFGHLVMDILATAPADALREHDAALIEGLADEWHADNAGTSPRAYNWLREKARQRREEQS